MGFMQMQNMRMFSNARITLPAPAFSGMAYTEGQFKKISLADYAGKYVVLFFYPLDFTFVCPTEICAFNDAAKHFKDTDCEVISCSVDSHFTHMEYANKPRAQGERGGQGRKTYNDDGENMRGGRRAYDGDKRAYDGDKNDNSSRYQVKK